MILILRNASLKVWNHPSEEDERSSVPLSAVAPSRDLPVGGCGGRGPSPFSQSIRWRCKWARLLPTSIWRTRLNESPLPSSRPPRRLYGFSSLSASFLLAALQVFCVRRGLPSKKRELLGTQSDRERKRQTEQMEGRKPGLGRSASPRPSRKCWRFITFDTRKVLQSGDTVSRVRLKFAVTQFESPPFRCEGSVLV